MRGLRLGDARPVARPKENAENVLPAHHLVTHSVVVGMTGSGKTGLLIVMIEEALRAGVPVLAIDVKGDLPNLLLSFPSFGVVHFRDWAASQRKPGDTRTDEELAESLAAERAEGLTSWGIDEAQLSAFHDSIDLRVITPGSTAGEALHLLSSLERRSPRWDTDPEDARSAMSAAVSLVLRLLGRDPDPVKSPDHVLLSLLAERRFQAGQGCELGALLAEVIDPPVATVGALELEAFLPKSERKELAAALNTLLASTPFASWRQGETLDIGSWLTPRGWRTPGVIVSVAHLDDEERALVLGVVLEEVVSWMRSLSGTKDLRALIVFDEVFGFLPPYPADPPTKKPLLRLMKQARAYGVGVVLATQNPMDLDYKSLSNAGIWGGAKLQTDGDRRRFVDGLAQGIGADKATSKQIGQLVSSIAPRFFVLRNVHDGGALKLLQPRYAMSYLHGPMTREELRRALEPWRERRG